MVDLRESLVDHPGWGLGVGGGKDVGVSTAIFMIAIMQYCNSYFAWNAAQIIYL